MEGHAEEKFRKAACERVLRRHTRDCLARVRETRDRVALKRPAQRQKSVDIGAHGARKCVVAVSAGCTDGGKKCGNLCAPPRKVE